MTDRNWDAEMKKIDRQLESVSDEAMFPTKTAKGPQAQAHRLPRYPLRTTICGGAVLCGPEPGGRRSPHGHGLCRYDVCGFRIRGN